MRLEVLGDYLGIDGLRISDFPEIKIEDGKVTFTNTPTLVVVREELNKARHQILPSSAKRGARL